MRELAEFIFRFGEKYDVLLDIKNKPMKSKKDVEKERSIWMKKKVLAVILLVMIAVVGCGKVNGKTESNTSDEVKDIAAETEIIDEEDTLSQEEDEGTTEETVTEVVEENATETVLTGSAQPEKVQKTENKKTEQKKTQVETPAVTTPVVNETAVATPEVKECEHLYEPVETEEYDRIEPHYIFGCNGCGFPLFTIDPETHDAVNIPDLYFHRECYSEKLGMMCPKPCGWHSEVYYQGYCYTCHDEIQLRACTYFYVRAETCVQNTGDLGGYEKVEPGYAYIKSCDCGANTIMVGQNGKNLLLKKEQCVYCGHTKSYPEK